MGGFFNWLSNNGQLVVIIGFFALSAFGGVARWLQEQAAKKKAEAERRRKIEAQLRTGRAEPTATQPSASSSSPAPQPETDAPETFAERRRRQIEEMRRRQEAAERQRRTAQQRRPMPTAEAPQPVPQTPEPVLVPPSAPVPSQSRVRRRTPTPSSQPRAKEASPEIESLAAAFERRERLERSSEGTSPTTRALGGLGPGLDRQSLRKAVVLAEVLASPVALRDDGQKAV